MSYWFAGASLIATLTGTGLQMKASADAADKQQSIINQAAQEDERLNKKREITTNNFAKQTFTPETRAQNFENAAKSNETSLVDALMKASGGNLSDVKRGAEGNLSSDYTRASGAATAASTADILKRARLMSKTNAPSLLYGQDALAGGQMQSDLSGLDSAGRRNNGTTDLLISMAGDKGSLMGGLLTGLGAAGGAYSGSRLSKK
jgi:hypothetical protein